MTAVIRLLVSAAVLALDMSSLAAEDGLRSVKSSSAFISGMHGSPCGKRDADGCNVRLIENEALFVVAQSDDQSRRSQAGSSVPVRVGGGEAEHKACGGAGEVAGLDLTEDFVSVRSGPGRSFREVDRLRNRQFLYLCDYKEPWIGVVYTRELSADCGLAFSKPEVQAYGGPCRSGWLHERYVLHVAG